MLGAGWTYSEYSAGQNEGPETVSGLFAFIPPPKRSGCSRSGYKVIQLGTANSRPKREKGSDLAEPFQLARTAG